MRRLRIESLEDRRLLAITVNTIDDERDFNIFDGDVSLRDAILEATPGETINFSTNPTHGLNGGTISLLQSLGEIAFSKNLTIDASMLPAGITINAFNPTPRQNGIDPNPGDGSRIFNITGGGSTLVTMKGLTLTGGDVTGSGGAIYSTASLDIQNCTIVGNNCTIVDYNEDLVDGGGVYADAGGGSINIQNSKIEKNYAMTVGDVSVSNGAGVLLRVSQGSITITDTSISNNQALGVESNVDGLTLKAVYDSIVNLTRVTISGNHADDDAGGANIRKEGSDVTLADCTISGNTADHNKGSGDSNVSGGIYLDTRFGGSTTVERCLISENSITGNNSNDPGVDGMMSLAG